MAPDHNRNPTGKNQHAALPPASDPLLSKLLRKYHAEGLRSNAAIRKRLVTEAGITMPEGTIKNRRNALALYGSRSKKSPLTREELEQLVVRAMDRDPARGHGKATIHARVAWSFGRQIPRDFVAETMHLFDPEGFELRSPNNKRIFRVKKGPLGIHERWAGDGHDKLYSIGFAIWAIVDDATGKWLGAWVVPSNRLGTIVGYLYLCLIEEYGGMPLQTSLDCGSETTQLYGIANALREIFHPEIPLSELPAVRYMRSVHNISIERSWLRLRLEWGNNAVTTYHRGTEDGTFDSDDATQALLVRWLWPKMLQATLDDFRGFRNAQYMRKDKEKLGPSACSRNEAFSDYAAWGGQNFLQPVDREVIREMKEALGGENLLKFVPDAFAERAEAAYGDLGVMELNMDNAWHVFADLHTVLFPEVYMQ